MALCVWLRKSTEEVEVNVQPGKMQTNAGLPAGIRAEGAPFTPGTVEEVAKKEKAEASVLSEVKALRSWARPAAPLEPRPVNFKCWPSSAAASPLPV